MLLQLRNRRGTPLVIKATTNDEPAVKSLKKYNGHYIGKRYGNLTVIAYPTTKYGLRGGGAICKCDCGNLVAVASMATLIDGKKTRCYDCGHDDRVKASKRRWEANPSRKSKYGELRNERLYKVWMSMKSRCNSTFGDYADVNLCDEWMDYRIFREWAYSHGYDENAPFGKCTIDRINPFGDYEPSNCRFVDLTTQARNKRRDWLLLDEETRQMLLDTAIA